MENSKCDLRKSKDRNGQKGRLIQRFPNLLYLSICILMILFFIDLPSLRAQERVKPTWWYGIAGAANLNFYRGTTQILNNSITTYSAFHDGFGVAPYGAALVEYRPDPVWGLMLYLAYDSRRGLFNRMDAPPPNAQPSLQARFDYIAFEPSLRVAPFAGNFYAFIGPRLSFNVHNSFEYEPKTSPNAEAEWSDVYGVRLSMQVGVGYDIPIVDPGDRTQVVLSPFISFHPYFGEQPRKVEELSLTTLRIGAALKFGCGPAPAAPRAVVTPPPPVEKVVVPPPLEKEVQFSVQAPKFIPGQHVVKEILPLRDYIFFDPGQSQIPSRYILLTKSQALGFKEEQLQDCQKDPGTRASRQLTIYHNILNIIGDRMRKHSAITITLIGSSGGKGADVGQGYANSVKQYLVSIFGISESRITTEGRSLPIVPSEQPNSSQDLDLIFTEDNRVDIVSTSPDLMLQVKNNSSLCIKPVEVTSRDQNMLDSPVTINVAGAKESLQSWSLEVTDTKGNVQHYGPFTRDHESISGQAILKDNQSGNYKIVMLAQTKSGKPVRKESSIYLVRSTDQPSKEELRYSILFEFDKSKTVDTYKTFLTDIVAPIIPDNATVIISGHTDIVGEEEHNMNLSRERAMEAQNILEYALSNAGKHNVVFQTNGFGESTTSAPFGNTLPEERFYNRTVIIDIIPANGVAEKK